MAALGAPAVTSAQTLNPSCVGTHLSGGWTLRFIDPSDICYPDGLGGKDGADGVDPGFYDSDGYLDITTGWEESGEVVVATNPGPAAIHSVFQWPTTVLAGDKKGLEDSIFVENNGQNYVASAAEGDTREVFIHSLFTTQPLPDPDVFGNGEFYMRLREGDILLNGGCNDLVVGAKDSTTDGGIHLAAGIWFYACPTGWQPGDPVDGWIRQRIAGDLKWIMELELVDIDLDGDLDVVFTDRKKVGWMENPLNGPGDPFTASDWKKHIIENAGGSKTGGVGDPYRWSHYVDITNDGVPELLVATNYGFDRGVVGRWFQMLPGSDPHDDYWLANEIVVEGGAIPFNGDKDGELVSKAIHAADLSGDGRIELVMSVRGGIYAFNPYNLYGNGVGVYRLSLPPGVSQPPRCGNAPDQTPCTLPGTNQWVYTPIADSFDSMKYDNLVVRDLDGDGDLDVATVEENVDKHGLGTVWFENKIATIANPDFVTVPANAGSAILAVTANDGDYIDKCSLSITSQPYPALVPTSSPCGSVTFTPNPTPHDFAFTYQVCRQDDSSVCRTSTGLVTVTDPTSLIANGSFESPSLASTSQIYTASTTPVGFGWAVTGEVVHATSAGWQPSDGSQSLNLKGPGSLGAISQTVTIYQPGVVHVVEFSQAANPNLGESTITASVDNGAGSLFARSDFVFDSTGTTAQNMGWVDRALLFTPVLGQPAVLKFEAKPGFGPAIDDVRVTPVPSITSFTPWNVDPYYSDTNAVFDVDLADFITLSGGTIDFSGSRILSQPDPQCGTVEPVSDRIYRFVPAPGVELLAYPTGPCTEVSFVLDLPVTERASTPVKAIIDLVPWPSAPPVANDDAVEIEFDDINNQGEYIDIYPLANDTDANCPVGLCYGEPVFTTPPEFNNCFVHTEPAAGPKGIRCKNYTGGPPPQGAPAVFTIPYTICDAFDTIPPVDCDSATITVTIQPRPPIAPHAQVDADPLDFGDIVVDVGVNQSLQLSNSATSETDLVVSGIDLAGSAAFTLLSPSPFANPLPWTIAPGTSQSVVVRAQAGSAGAKTATLEIRGNDPDLDGDALTVSVQATALLPPQIQANQTELDFGQLAIGAYAQLTVQIQNAVAPGGADLHVSAIAFANDADGLFTLVAPQTIPFVLAPGSTKNVKVGVTPTALGVYTANLSISSDDPGGDLVVPLVLTAFASTGGSHYGDAHPLTEGWIVTPGDLGTNTVAIASDPDFPGVSAFGVHDANEALRYQVPGPAPGIGSIWTLHARLRLRDLDKNLNDATQLEVADGELGWRVRVGTSAAGDTELEFVGGGTYTIPAVQPGRSDYFAIDIVRGPDGDVDVFVNGVERQSDWAGVANANRRVTFGDGWTTNQTQQVSRGRYETVEFVLGVLPACRNGLDDDGDGVADYDVAAGDPDCSQPNDPTENDPDHDKDGLLDGFELANGFDPIDPDGDANTRFDGHDDLDADGLGNAAEQRAGTLPDKADTDDDGLLDGEEVGHGSFGPQQIITNLTDGAFSVFVADLDGDGDADVLSASRFDNEIAWYPNDGAGNFGAQQIISTATLDPRSVFAARIDRDAAVDVLSASFADDKVAWYPNTGSGGFGAQRVISGLVDEGISVFAADVDGDGDQDVLAASRAGSEIVWFENNDGSGSFSGAKLITGLADTPISVFAADLDGDGDADVLSASLADDEIAWYENLDGAGSFGPQQIISSLADEARSVFAADVDGDGDLDVLSASNADNKIAWYENDGTGGFGAQQIVSTQANGAKSVFAADVDGDGDVDVLSGSGGPDAVAWYENEDGLGTFGPMQLMPNTAAGASYSVAGADLDGDGDLDVVAALVLADAIVWYENVGISDPLDPDSDDDGLLDGFEFDNGFDPRTPGEADLDPDVDGLDNLAEQANGTDPLVADTDGDGYPDGLEVARGSNPLDAQSVPLVSVPALGAWGMALLVLSISIAAFRQRRAAS